MVFLWMLWSPLSQDEVVVGNTRRTSTFVDNRIDWIYFWVTDSFADNSKLSVVCLTAGIVHGGRDVWGFPWLPKKVRK